MRHRSESGEVEDRPFWHQRGWQLSAVFVALLLCMSVVVALSGGPDAAAKRAEQAIVPGPLSSGAGPDGSRPGGCHTDDTDQTAPAQPPGDVTWRPLNGAKVPLSASAGPVKSSGQVLWCFAHTPLGAVMAANVIPRQMSGSAWRTVTEQQVVAGNARDVFVAMRSSQQGAPPQYTANSMAGFMVMSYSPDTAVVRLLIKQPPAVYATTDFTVAWDGGDWKVKALAGGDLHTPVTAVTANGGFVMWKV
jgi:hypothetical protein